MLDERRMEIVRKYGLHERDTSSSPVLACFLALKLERILKEIEKFPEKKGLENTQED